MPDTLRTLNDLIQINDQNLADIDVNDLLQRAPLLARLFAKTSSNGSQHKYLKETGAPTVGFRALNAGREHSKSTDTPVTEALAILDASFHVDKMYAEGYSGGVDAAIFMEAIRHLRQAFKVAELNLINGAATDGFDGLYDSTDLQNISDAMVVDGGGVGVGVQTSVLAIVSNDDELSVTMGNSGNIEIGESFLQFVEDGSGNKFPAWMTPIDGWLGLQRGSIHCVGRLANIDATATLNDTKMSSLYEVFPEDKRPDFFVMNKTAASQLRSSRTTYSPTGAPAPWPTEWNGIPIIETGSLTQTEAVVA